MSNAERAQGTPRVSVVGLGKLGSCMAASIADRGFEVVGLDVVPEVVDAINRGKAPVVEPELQARIESAGGRLRATHEYAAAILGTDVTFLVVPTPSEANGGFSLEFVLAAVRQVGRVLAGKDDYHLVVLTSTVLPGASANAVIPALEEASGKRCGVDFGYCYSPEFIALGSVIRNFLNPDFVLVGESDERAGRLLEEVRSAISENDAPVARMSPVNAELAKLAVNTYVTTKITFANTLTALCESLPGGDVDVVTEALGLDTRIGARGLKGGLGYGGPCFPRDNRALAHLVRELGQDPALAETTDRLNNQLAERVVDRVLALVPAEGTVAILGLAYKPLSPVIDDSQPLWMAQRLASSGARVVAYDPLALENARAALGDSVEWAESVEVALSGADVVLIANPDPAFLDIRAADFAHRPGVVVVDCWRVLAGELANAPEVEYIAVGVGAAQADATPLIPTAET